MNTAGRRAVMGGGVFATLAAGIVIGLAVTNGSADEQSPTVETTETTVVQVQATETLPPATVPAPAVSTEAPAVAAPTVQAVTTAPAPAETAEAAASVPATTAADPVVNSGFVEGPTAEPGAPRAPQAQPMPGNTEQANGGQD